MKPKPKPKPYDWLRNPRKLSPITGKPHEVLEQVQRSGIGRVVSDSRINGVKQFQVR